MMEDWKDRVRNLRSMAICRFCLDDKAPLHNIFKFDEKSVPLPLQIMACAAIEVLKNDAMPQLICDKCKTCTEQAYNFKATCKKSDDALRSYLETGDLRNLQRISLKDLKLQIASKRQISQELSTSLESESTSPTEKRCKLDTISPIKYENKNDSIEEETPLSPTIEFEINSLNGDDSTSDSNLQHEVVDDHDDEVNENPILKVTQVQTDVFSCNQCHRSFALKQLLDLHMISHGRERNYECSICNKKFLSKNDLSKHTQTHSSEKPFECVVCNKAFSKEGLLHNHERTHVDVPKYSCTSCDCTFLTREDLECHALKHNKKRPYTCDICNKSYTAQQSLERHIEALHAKEKPHKCDYCDASFNAQFKLMKHIKTHAGLRPYPCKICGKKFMLQQYVTKHLRTHYPLINQVEGRYRCGLCSMSFNQKKILINHSMTHSVDLLKCVICSVRFDNVEEVTNHVYTHLYGLRYYCEKCNCSFETEDERDEHEKKHEEMECGGQIEEENGADKIDDGLKCCNQFLKVDLNDVEDEIIEEEGNDDVVVIEGENLKSQDVIKPIVRSEGTKVYARKTSSLIEKSQNTSIRGLSQDSSQNNLSQNNLSQKSKPIRLTIENFGLTLQDLNSLPTKQYVDMKVGDKRLRVQKLMMTKAEIQAMAKQGKIVLKGDTTLLRKPVQKTKHTMETVVDENPKQTPQKQTVKKTYVKKVNGAAKIVKDKNVGGNEDGSQSGEEVILIDD